jgi:hypothetical protein
MSGASDGLQEGMSRTIRTIAFAMANGIAMLIAVSLFFYARSTTVVPTPASLKFINMMTIVSMAASVSVIFASEIAWRKMLAGAVAADVNAKTQTAFIVRACMREGAALIGSVTLFLACQDGVLRAYPAYWVDLVPAGLFWSFLYLHWPSLENLKTELSQILPP